MWAEAVLTLAYLLNRSPTVIMDTIPAEKWHVENLIYPNFKYSDPQLMLKYCDLLRN